MTRLGDALAKTYELTNLLTDAVVEQEQAIQKDDKAGKMVAGLAAYALAQHRVLDMRSSRLRDESERMKMAAEATYWSEMYLFLTHLGETYDQGLYGVIYDHLSHLLPTSDNPVMPLLSQLRTQIANIPTNFGSSSSYRDGWNDANKAAQMLVDSWLKTADGMPFPVQEAPESAQHETAEAILFDVCRVLNDTEDIHENSGQSYASRDVNYRVDYALGRVIDDICTRFNLKTPFDSSPDTALTQAVSKATAARRAVLAKEIRDNVLVVLSDVQAKAGTPEKARALTLACQIVREVVADKYLGEEVPF